MGNGAWSLTFKKDATLLENVQKCATKMIPSLKEVPYQDRLAKPKLPLTIIPVFCFIECACVYVWRICVSVRKDFKVT